MAEDTILGVDWDDIALHPDVFVEAWLTKKSNRARLLLKVHGLEHKTIYDDPLYADMGRTEKWFFWQDASRAFTLKTIDQKVFDVIEGTILDCSVEVRHYYAEAWWANVELLDKLKDDKARPVVNSVAMNPFITEEIALYLATKHKTPGIRIDIAMRSRSLLVLNTIFNGTQSEDIRKAVLDNPLFGGGS